MMDGGVRKADPVILLLGVLAFWANGDNYAAAPLLVRISADLGVDIATAALTVTSYMLLFGALTIVFGPLGDRYGRDRILKVAAFGSAVFSMLSAVASDLASLVAVRAVNGAFSAGIMPLAVAVAGESATPRDRQSRIGTVMGLMFLGGALATVIGGTVSYFGSWKAVYFIYGAAELVVAILLAVFMKSPARTASRAGLAASYRAVLSKKALRRLIGLLLFIGFSTLGAFSYLGKLLQDQTGLNLMFVGCLLGAYGIGTLVGGRAVPGLRARAGSRLFLIVGILGGAGFLSLGLTSAAVIAVPALFAYGFGFICLQSSIIATAQDLVPDHRGTVMSAASFTMVASGAVGTFFNGKVISSLGFGTFVCIAAAAFAVAGILAAVLLRAAPHAHGRLTARSGGTPPP